MPPAIDAMLQRCDAALVIGDPALYLDHADGWSVEDRPGRAVDQPDGAAVRVGVLGGAPRGAAGGRADGAGRTRATRAWPHRTRLPTPTAGPSGRRSSRAYLRDNIQYVFDERAAMGCGRYYELAAKHGVIDEVRAPVFY